jgi:hypothetical protein
MEDEVRPYSEKEMEDEVRSYVKNVEDKTYLTA